MIGFNQPSNEQNHDKKPITKEEQFMQKSKDDLKHSALFTPQEKKK